MGPVPPTPPVAPVAGAPALPPLPLPELPPLATVPPVPPSSPSSLSPPHATMEVAPIRVAPNAKVAARPSRVVGNGGAGTPASESASPQNGQSCSEARTWRLHDGHG